MLCLSGCASAYPPYMAIQGTHWMHGVSKQQSLDKGSAAKVMYNDERCAWVVLFRPTNA